MGFLNEFFLRDLPDTIQMGTITAGHRCHSAFKIWNKRSFRREQCILEKYMVSLLHLYHFNYSKVLIC